MSCQPVVIEKLKNEDQLKKTKIFGIGGCLAFVCVIAALVASSGDPKETTIADPPKNDITPVYNSYCSAGQQGNIKAEHDSCTRRMTDQRSCCMKIEFDNVPNRPTSQE